MSKQTRKLPVDTQFDYDKLIDMKAEQLDDLVKECEVNIERLRLDIVKNYQAAQPYLTQMRILKQQLRKVSEKMDAAKTFLSMEKNGSLVSNIDLEELRKSAGESKEKDEPGCPDTPPRQETVTKTPTKFKSQLSMNWINKSKQAIDPKLKKSHTTTSLKRPV